MGGGGGGGEVGTRSRICQNGWDVWDARRVGSCCYPAMSKLISSPYIYIYICLYNHLLSVSYTT